MAAARQAAACRELFRRELGVEPGPTLAAAAATVTATPTATAATGSGAVRGSSMSDVGRYGPALCTLQQAVDISADDRGSSYALSMIGRPAFAAARV